MKRFTILGSGSSGGVPRIGGDWGSCDPLEPKNKRLRSSFLVEQGEGEALTQLLVDTSPDMRAQLIASDISRLDGVVYTHSHADHIHGIDDLRVIYFNRGERIPVFYDAATGAALWQKFGYCFEQPDDAHYKPILYGQEIVPLETFSVSGEGGAIDVLPFLQHHGHGHSLGFRFGGLAYATDVHEFPDQSLEQLEGLDVLILDALRYTSHPCHFSVAEALEVIEQVKPKRAILTHLHIDLDYQTLKAELPAHVEPAYDGMVIEL